MPMTLCKHCGRQFEVLPSRLTAGRGSYCGKTCADAAKRKPRPHSHCAWCGRPLPAEARPDTRFCGRICVTAHLADERSHRESSATPVATPVGVLWFADPWADGAIDPDPYTGEPIRTPDPVLGF